jgi:signal transduction histidine kinase/DNA-binding response OmpR family regulator/ligand-binding sensor domain-containing protein
MQNRLFLLLFCFCHLAGGTAECQTHAKPFTISINKYALEEGLPHREVLSLHQDKKGFIWVGTRRGLCRFDGHSFQYFDIRTDSFRTEEINKIFEDEEGYFWLLPEGDLREAIRWHPLKNTDALFNERYEQTSLLPEHWFYDRYIYDRQGNILVGGQNYKGIWEFRKNGRQRNIQPDKFRHFQLLRCDQSLWAIADSSSLVQLDRQGKLIEVHARGRKMHANSLNNNRGNPTFLLVDERGTWLFGESGTLRRIPGNYTAPVLIPGADIADIGEDLLLDNNRIYRLDGSLLLDLNPSWQFIGNPFYRGVLFDEQGHLWLGSNFGLIQVTIRKNKFRTLLAGNSDRAESGIAIRGMLVQGDELIVNQESKGHVHIQLANGKIKGAPGKSTGHGYYGVYKLSDGRLVLGQYGNMSLLDEEGRLLRNVSFPPKVILSFYQFAPDSLWLGTDQGLYVCQLSNFKFRQFSGQGEFTPLKDASINCILRLRDGGIGMGTDEGLFIFDSNGKPKARFHESGRGQFYLPDQQVLHFYEAPAGDYWLGTAGGGLLHLLPERASGTDKVGEARSAAPQVAQFSRMQGFSNDVIYAVYPDRHGNLWLSSDKGIMRFNMGNGAVQTYLEQDGISYHEFNKIAHCRDEAGNIYFGGLNGITVFHPDELAASKSASRVPLAITVYQKYVAGEDRLKDFTKQLSEEPFIILNPSDRFFRLEVALLNYNQVQGNRYAWRIEGLDENWNYTDRRDLSFGKLPYGNYTLRIKAADIREQWSEQEIALPLKVAKPFYLSAWFFLLCFAAAAFSVFLYTRYRTHQLRQQRTVLQKEVERRTRTIEQQKEELRSLDELKSRFFTNVSHELRTPLSLLVGPTDSLLRQTYWQEKDRRLLGFIRKNVAHLLGLVNEILDLAKLESGRMGVKEQVVHFHSIMLAIVAQFSSFSDSESVHLDFEYKADKDLYLWLDAGKFEKIIHNFLSNALKYTPAGGRVRLSAEEEAEHLLIRVQDEGPGIHPEDLPYLFDRFFQSRKTAAAVAGGTGIGLSICRELAQLTGGEVWAESEYGRGSIFFFRFDKKTASATAFLQDTSQQDAVDSRLKGLSSEMAVPENLPADADTLPADGIRLLIAEDNQDLREYLALLLGEQYSLLFAQNGQEAWELLQKAPLPDLILSDLMMPLMDGLSLLEKVKDSDALRHIPFIMLTARADSQVRLRALRTGVDDYLTKPFAEEELLVRIDKLLENYRERLAAYQLAAQEPEMPDAAPVLSAADALWLERLEEIFRRNLANPFFVLEEAAQELYISERQLTRRLKLLTGLTPNNYFREMRLQEARSLLQSKAHGTLKEVSFAVGFQQPQYFSRLFQERFGVPPTYYFNH